MTVPPNASLLAEMLVGRQNAEDERRIIEMLATADTESLNEMIAHVDPKALVASLDNRLVGADNRTAFLDRVVIGRLAEFTLENRARIVHGLQAAVTTGELERAIEKILLASRGEELTRLKNLLNSTGDHHDLEQLVFGDIDDEGVRTSILEHIAAEAEGVDLGGEAKVLSDIDDTVVCALHDSRYPKGTIYPGVLEFLEALDDGPRGEPASTGDLTFVTARPEDVFGLVERTTMSALQEAGIAKLSILTGGLVALRSKASMAAKKVDNIRHFAALFPEYALVFTGDSGQGDVMVGEAMYEAVEDVRAVFIHDVVGTPAEERAAHKEHGIHFVDTYVEAAAIARDLGLISADGAQRVLDAAREGVNGVDWKNDAQREAVEALVERDAALI